MLHALPDYLQNRRWKLYGVFIGSRWGMTYSRKQAINTVKEQGQGEVRVMLYSPDTKSWDSPTFYVCSNRLFTLNVTKEDIN